MGKRITFFIALIFISGLIVTAAGATPVIIGFKDKAHPEIVQPYGKVTHSYKYVPAVAADLPEQAIENLKKNPKVAYIEPDYEVEALEETVPWGISGIEAPSVHAAGYNGIGVNVSVIDTGIDYTHPDLAKNYKGGWDFVNNDNNPMDDNGHGTHCAGIIAAVDNEEGVIGVAPGANLYALKVLNKQGSGTISNIISAIEWSIDNKMKIISMSLGSDYYSVTLKNACDKAETAGILLVAAAGNDYDASVSDTVDYPGGYGSVIAVAATDNQNNRAWFSSTGPAVELAAPGVNIYSTYWLRGSTYKNLSGTSMACPHVAGTAALVWAAHPELNNFEVRTKLQDTVTDLGAKGKDEWYGFGLVNASNATAISVPDSTAPKISGVVATSGSNSATITWDTDEASSSTVKYSMDKSNFEKKSDSTLVTDHNVELTLLKPSTTYYYEVISSDAAGNTVVDNNSAQYYSFATTEENSGTYVYIDSVQVATNSRLAGKSVFVNATAIVTILDNTGKPVKGANVSGYWSGATSDTDSAVTGDMGTVTVYSNEVKYKSGTLTFTFTANNVSYTIPWDNTLGTISGTGTYTKTG